MPNLYKQYLIHSESDNKRVINSNELVEERLKLAKELIRRQQDKDGGFQEGIPMTEVIEEETISVQEANEEAEKILEDAKKQAAEIIRQAHLDAEQIEVDAEKKGYQDGLLNQEAELKELKKQLEAEYSEKENQLLEVYQDKLETMEKDLMEVMLTIFNKVFHIQFDDKKEIILYLVGNAMQNIEEEKVFRIKVSESNAIFLKNHKNDIIEKVGSQIDFEILSDNTFDNTVCIIETDSGIFNCSLGVQLENLIKDLKSLCS